MFDFWTDKAAKAAADRHLYDLLQVALVIVVVYPLWRADALADSAADEMARIFNWAPMPAVIVRWVYVFKNYVLWSNAKTREQLTLPGTGCVF